MNMKLGHVELFVKEPVKAKDFYINVLGFELIEIQNDKVVWLKIGDNEILLRPGENKLDSSVYSQSSVGFVLYTHDLGKTANELKSKGLVFKGTDGSDNCLTFTDDDGNWFQLVNPAEH